MRAPAAAMVIAGAAEPPCRPRSARYAEKGYPNYADPEPDGSRAPRWRNGGGGGQAKKSEARRGRKRGRREASEEAAAAKFQPPILQVEEAAAREHGTKRRMTGATVAGEAFPMIEDGEEEVAVTDGGVDERGVGKSWKLRVKETLRAFSSNYLHFVQVALLVIFVVERGK